MKVCLKELRETMTWLKLLRMLDVMQPETLEPAIGETDELIAVFFTSIATARRSAKRGGA